MLFIPAHEIKDLALQMGFNACGIAQALPLQAEADFFKQWLNNGYHANMQYMENHSDKRCNPQLLLENAQSVISVLFSYAPNQKIQGKYKVAKYAYGQDYHFVIKSKLHQFIAELTTHYPQFEAIAYCDTAPIMDRVWAQKAGLGFIGKNQCLINPQLGSFCFIGEILCNAQSEYDTPLENECGSCRRCIEACPNQALTANGLDARKCISYHTIENKEEQLPVGLKTNNYILGCDQCQNVCPYNQELSVSKNNFPVLPQLKQLLETSEIENISKTEFKKIAKGTAFSRIKYQQFLRNIQKAKESE